jgi:hypothetical protein
MTTRALLAPLILVGLLVVGEPFTAPTPSPTPFTTRVVDAQTGQGVPGIRLTTDNGVVCYTQLNGEASWGERSLLGRSVRFDVHDDTGRFVHASATLDVTRGGKAVVSVRRQ